MSNKWNIVVICIGLIGCAQKAALQGLPHLTDGSQSRWIYHCKESNIAVEYANRSSRYSATLELEQGNQVLDIEPQQHGVLARLDPLTWHSEDGEWFTLKNHDETVLNQCRAIRQEQRGNLNISLGALSGK